MLAVLGLCAVRGSELHALLLLHRGGLLHQGTLLRCVSVALPVMLCLWMMHLPACTSILIPATPRDIAMTAAECAVLLLCN